VAAQSLSPVVGSFKNFFPACPQRRDAAAAWTDTQRKTIARREASRHERQSAHAAAWEDRNGMRALRVEVAPISRSREAAAGRQPFDVAGAASAAASISWDRGRDANGWASRTIRHR